MRGPNLITDPTGQTASLWGGVGGAETIASTTADAVLGNALRVTSTTTASSTGAYFNGGGSYIPIVGGSVYSASAMFNTNAAAAVNVQFQIDWYNAGGYESTTVVDDSQNVSPGVAKTVFSDGTLVAPGDALLAFWYVYTVSLAVGKWLDVTSMIFAAWEKNPSGLITRQAVKRASVY